MSEPRHFCINFRSLAVLRKTAQKCLGSLIMRIFKYLCRRALLNDGAAVHEHDMIGHIAGKRHLVGDDDHGGVLVRQ